jgi:excisionase family DNA binding protein
MRVASNLPSLLETNEVAAILRLNPQTVRAMARRGDIKAVRLGGSWRYSRASLAKLASADGGDNNGQQ